MAQTEDAQEVRLTGKMSGTEAADSVFGPGSDILNSAYGSGSDVPYGT